MFTPAPRDVPGRNAALAFAFVSAALIAVPWTLATWDSRRRWEELLALLLVVGVPLALLLVTHIYCFRTRSPWLVLRILIIVFTATVQLALTLLFAAVPFGGCAFAPLTLWNVVAIVVRSLAWSAIRVRP